MHIIRLDHFAYHFKGFYLLSNAYLTFDLTKITFLLEFIAYF